MSSLLRDTAAYRLLTVHRYLAVDLPKTTTAVGVGSLLGLAGVHLYVLLGASSMPIYLQAYFAFLMACCVVAAVLMCLGAAPKLVGAGWLLGTFASMLFLVVYVISRLFGLPSLPELENWWDSAPGSVAGACALMLLTVMAAMALGITVPYPRKRDWHD